jgi:hypothetical protein
MLAKCLQMKLNKVYHCYDKWEEVAHNMWGTSKDARGDLNLAIELTSDHIMYGSYMHEVIKHWPISCENALTDSNISQKAWIGHAAVAFALQIPESITRKAWSYLDDKQRILANQAADRAIREWRLRYIKDREVYKNVGEQVLLEWDT